MKTSGIYKIINKVNGKYYVGSSVDVYRRWNEHKSELNRNCHGNNYLQNSWNKYGKDNFEFIIIETCEADKLIITEQKYIDLCKNDRNISYNIGYDAISSFLGKHHTEEAKEKNRISHLGKYEGDKNPNYGKKHTDAIRKKISKALKGKYCGTKSWRRGKHHTKEAKEKIGIKNRKSNIFNVKNIKTDEVFSGTRHEFVKKFNIFHICRLLDKRLKTCGGWILT
jgi:group I intron endonuclease